MVVIDVNIEDFEELLGREIDVNELKENLPMMGTAWERELEKGFKIDVFPNRPDLLSIEGLVRAYKAYLGEEKGLKEYHVKKSEYKVIIEEKTQKIRPYFVTAVIKNVDFDDSLIRSIIQMQEKLHVTHGRRRRKVAIGLHNLDPIKFPVTYTTKSPEYKFRPLGERFEKTLEWMLNDLPKGKEYAWILREFNEYPIIHDKDGMVCSMPPIINGEYTRIDEATENLFVDVTGTDLKAITEALNIICTTFADRGAEIFEVTNLYPDSTALYTPDLESKKIDITNDYIQKTLGMDFTPEETSELLSKMGYNTEIGDPLKIMIPCFRTDIMHPIDIVEDVAIAYGYNKFNPEIPEIFSEAGENPIEVYSRGLRNFLVGLGLLEVVTFMMSNEDKLFNKMMMSKEPVAVTSNPKMEAYSSLRNRLLPSIIEIISMNKHHPYPQNLYEVDDVVLLDETTETGARSERRCAIVLCHARANFSEIKGVMNSILDNLGLVAEVKQESWSCFIKGRRYTAFLDDDTFCWGGEVKPEVLEKWGIEMPVAALEINIETLFKKYEDTK